MILTSSVGWSLAVRTQTTQRARQLPGTLSRSAYTRVRPPGPPKPKPAVPSDRPFLPDAVRQRHASKDAPPLPSPPYTYEFEQVSLWAQNTHYFAIVDGLRVSLSHSTERSIQLSLLPCPRSRRLRPRAASPVSDNSALPNHITLRMQSVVHIPVTFVS